MREPPTPLQRELAENRHSWELFLAGYETGVCHGASIGYREGSSVLDEAAAYFVKHMRPLDSLTVAQARRRAARRPVDTRTPQQLRADAARSWGLPPPEEPEAQRTDDQLAETSADTCADASAELSSVDLNAAELNPVDLCTDDDWFWDV